LRDRPHDSDFWPTVAELCAPFYQSVTMIHIPDLTPMEHPQLIAVGYLAQGDSFSRGPIGEVFVGALLDLLLDPWQPSVTAGFHRCEFCRISGGPQRLQYAGRSIPLGASNLYVPHEGKIFVSPSLIAHYVDAHEYAPPEVFQEAVVRCPPMRSIEYLRAIVSNGPPGFARRQAR
jgi:hypothetical protein